MPRIQPRSRTTVGEYEPKLAALEEFFGFLPNDYLTMGHKPAMMNAVLELTQAVIFAPGKTTMKLRLLTAYAASSAARCMYCIAHCGALAVDHGISIEQIQNMPSFETHSAFTPEEKAVLRIASKSATAHNSVTDHDFDALREFLDEEGCAEVVGVIALMGFYNRWNDTLATTLERPPLSLANQVLIGRGWEIGKHA